MKADRESSAPRSGQPLAFVVAEAEQRFRQPGAEVLLAACASLAQLVDAQPRHHGDQPGLGVANRRRIRAAPLEPGVLQQILGVGAAAQQPVGQAEQLRS